jgi:hypothetical protein
MLGGRLHNIEVKYCQEIALISYISAASAKRIHEKGKRTLEILASCLLKGASNSGQVVAQLELPSSFDRS